MPLIDRDYLRRAALARVNVGMLPAVPSDYDTKLDPDEEAAFQAWKAENAPNDSGEDYDLRGAWKAGLSKDADTGHMADTYKKPNHPTFSDQSQYAIGADAPKAGHWADDNATFIPPEGLIGKDAVRQQASDRVNVGLLPAVGRRAADDMTASPAAGVEPAPEMTDQERWAELLRLGIIPQGDPAVGAKATAEDYPDWMQGPLKAAMLPAVGVSRIVGGTPDALAAAFTAPKRAYTGELQVSQPDPVTGETHSTPQAIGEGMNIAMTAPLGAVAAEPIVGAVGSGVRTKLPNSRLAGLKQTLDARAEQMALPPAERIKPEDVQPVPLEEYRAAAKPPEEELGYHYPRADKPEDYPKGGRAVPLIEHGDEIASGLAKRMEPELGKPTQFFYHTEPIRQDMLKRGYAPEYADKWVKEFSDLYAAFSPRTETAQNIRNATMAMAKREAGVPLTDVVGPGTGGISEKGYPMMIGEGGIHRSLYDAVTGEGINRNKNPKPWFFSKNVAGNRSGVTADTHAIRAALDVMNEKYPGSIGGWIKPKYKAAYARDPSQLNPAMWIDDTLEGISRNKIDKQVEYAPFADIYHEAARKVGVEPAEGQSMGWFGSGERTGLKSERKTVPDLLNERINVTAKAFGEPEEVTRRRLYNREIGLLANPKEAAPLQAVGAEELKRLYHGTGADFERFKPGETGVHMGTPEQAAEFAEDIGGRIMPLDTDIKNPVRLFDVGSFMPEIVVPQLEDLGILTEKEAYAIDHLPRASYKTKMKLIRNKLIEKGYDGIVYLNRREGLSKADQAKLEDMVDDDDDFYQHAADEDYQNEFPSAKDSYIAIKPGTVKSAITGKTLFSNPKEAAGLAPAFYSRLREVTDTAPFSKATGKTWAGFVKNAQGVKPEELEWTGFSKWAEAQQGPVTKETVQKYLDKNEIKINEVVKGGKQPRVTYEDGDFVVYTGSGKEVGRHANAAAASRQADEIGQKFGATKHSAQQLPGGENYREMLLTLPKDNAELSAVQQRIQDITMMPASEHARLGEPLRNEFDMLRDKEFSLKQKRGEDFTSSHYDEPNVLAHMRFNDRVDANGKKTLFIEEIQSDWHQKGRKQGYNKGEKQWAWLDRNGDPVQFLETKPPQEAIDINTRNGMRLEQVQKNAEGVPDAPFKQSRDWGELALKRMLKYAADHGYDQIAWTPGAVQAERYDLSKHLDGINIIKDGNKLRVRGYKDDNELVHELTTPEELPNVIGKELAEKAIAGLEKYPIVRYEGLDLKVGERDMKEFYDKIVVNAANKIGKKYGAKVGTTSFGKIKDRYKELDAKIARGIELTPAERAEMGRLDANPGSGKGYDGEVWTLPLTPQLKEQAIKKGFPVSALEDPTRSVG